MRSRDVAFALNAAQTLAGQIQLAELARKRANGPAVRQFAESLIAENQKIGDNLRAVAAKLNLTLPSNATEQDISQHANLLGRSEGFDSAFLNDLATDTREDISSYKREAEKGKDPGMRAFAARTLPALQARHDAAKSLKSTRKAAGA